MPRSLALPFTDSAFFDDPSGARVHYRRVVLDAPATRTPRARVLLVHGFLGSTFNWRRVLDALTASGDARALVDEVCLVDVPGFAYSTVPAGYDHTMRNRARVLWRLLDALEWSNDARASADASAADAYQERVTATAATAAVQRPPLIVVGHSMGGAITTFMEEQRPHGMAGAVLVCSYLKLDDGVPGSGLFKLRCTRTIGALLFRAIFLQPGFMRKMLSDEAEGMDETDLDEYQRIKAYAPEFADRVMEMTAQGPTGQPLDRARITTPTVFIGGALDKTAPPADTIKFLADVPGRLSVGDSPLMPDAKHFPLGSHPRELTERLVAAWRAIVAVRS